MMQNQTVYKGAVAQVFTTKKGMYEFFVVEMEYFLPPIKYTNSEWLWDIATGKKKVRAVCFSQLHDLTTL